LLHLQISSDPLQTLCFQQAATVVLVEPSYLSLEHTVVQLVEELHYKP
jgi:hypothetical protein